MAVAPAAAQLRIVAKSDIVFCLLFNALATTLFSTAFVEVVDKAVSIDIVIWLWFCRTQLVQSNRYQSFTFTIAVSTVEEATQAVYIVQCGR